MNSPCEDDRDHDHDHDRSSADVVLYKADADVVVEDEDKRDFLVVAGPVDLDASYDVVAVSQQQETGVVALDGTVAVLYDLHFHFVRSIVGEIFVGHNRHLIDP